jgi:hypothetical protein
MAVTCWVGWWACQDLNLGPHPYQLNAGNRCANRRSRRSRPTVDANVMRSIGVQVCVLPSHIPNPPSVNPCSQVTHILGPFALDAQPVFAIMHRSRAALLHIVTDRVSIRCRSVGFTGCDPQGLARQYRRRTAPIVLRTRLQDRPTNSRSASRCPPPSASTLCPSSSTGAMDIPVDQAAASGPLLTADRARHELAATTGALGRRGRPGRCASGRRTGALARAPVPILNRRSPSSASRDGQGTRSGGLPAKAVTSSPCRRAQPPSPRRPRRGTRRTPAPGSAPAGR